MNGDCLIFSHLRAYCPSLPPTGKKSIDVTAMAVGAFLATSGIFLILAVLQILPNHVNAISQLGTGAKLLGGLLIGSGALSIGYGVLSFYFSKKDESLQVPKKIDEEKASFSFRTTTSPFIVTGMPQNRWSEVAEVALKWHENAFEKWKQVHGGAIPSFRTRDAASSDKGGIFKSSFEMLHTIHRHLTTPALERGSEEEPWDTVFVCKDPKQAPLQAIALFDKKENKLAYLATNPDNLRHELNLSTPTRVQGASTQIMLCLIKKSLEENRTLYVRATEDALSFYQKLHFEKDPLHARPSDGGMGIHPMKLSVEKMAQFKDML